MRPNTNPKSVPRRKEKEKECRICGRRTTHVYDWGFERFICVEHELKDEPEEEEPRYER